MRCGVVEREKRIEGLQRLLRHVAAHLLRLVHDDDRAICGNDVNRAAALKLVALRVDDARFLAPAILFQRSGEGLRVDNHHIDAAVGRKAVQLVQVGAGIDEEPRLFPVMLHEMVNGDLEGLLHALANGDGRHDHDELAPAIALVQLEHGLDVDIRLARSGFHFHVQRTASQPLRKGSGLINLVVLLHVADVFQQLFVGQLQHFVQIAGIVYFIHRNLIRRKQAYLLIHRREHRLYLAQIAAIGHAIGIGLSFERPYNAVNGVGLVLLYLKSKFHGL